MRLRLSALNLVLVLVFVLPVAAAAEFVVVPLDEPVRDLASVVAPPPAEPKLELPAQALLLPFFEVNKLDPTAETTLFSVRNVSATSSTDLLVIYRDVAGVDQSFSPVGLDPGQTLSININDVPGLDVDIDGVARGYALVQINDLRRGDEPGAKGIIGPPPQLPALVGDYFQVIQNEDFASGDRMLIGDNGSVQDFCSFMEARFLNGGAFSGGTDFLFFIDSPQGNDPDNDPPSALISVIDEAGTLFETVELYSADNVLKLPVSAITALAFGTLDIAFSGTSGFVNTTYSAQGRFSVGMDAVCKDRYAGDF